MSLKERRIAALVRTGTAKKRERLLAAPTKPFYGVLAISASLTLLGLIMVMSSSSITMFHNGQSPWTMAQRQGVWALIGLAAAYSLYRIEYRKLRRLVKPILIVGFAINFLPFVPGVGVTVNGARAWAGWGFLRFQPSEALKVAVVLFCADLMTKRHRYIEDARRTMYPMLAVMIAASGICAVQKDFGSALIFAFVVLTMCFMVGMPMRNIARVVGVFSILGVMMYLGSANIQSRVSVWWDLAGNKDYKGYQVWQSLLSVANGGVAGVGVGQGSGKWGYVPLSHSDFIFSTVAEELGLVGALAVLGAFAALVWFGIQIALGAKDMFGALLAGGITAWLGIQAVVNIAGVTGAMPMTGLTLPFISYGGSSLCVTMAATAILLNIARHMKQ